MMASGRSTACLASSVSASMKSTVPVISACLRRSETDALAPGDVLGPVFLPRRLHRFGKLGEPVGGVGAPVQEHVFDALEQVLGDLFIDLELPGIHDAHVQPGLDRVI